MRGYAPVSTAPGEKPSTLGQGRRRSGFIILLASIPALAIIVWLGHDKVPGWSAYDTVDAGGDGWAYVDQVGRERPLQRMSWGALEQQGAKRSIRQNLRGDKAYLISMYGAGWNNQVFQMMNLVYLAHLSDRIPIIPSFRWNHFGSTSLDVAVSEIFDLSQLSTSLNDRPIVELHEIKGTTSLPDRLKSVVYDGEKVQYTKDGSMWAVGETMYAEPMEEDTVGCWSMYASRGETQNQDGKDLYMINTPFTPLPRSVFNWNDDPGRPSFPRVADILRRRHDEEPPAGSLAILANYSMPHPPMWPDAHLACVDTVFGYADQIDRYDVGGEYRSGTGAWAVVGSMMRFSKGVERLGEMYLREIFGGDIPPYIAVHIRRDDFGDAFLALTQRQYAHAAWKVKETLRTKHGVDIKHVLVTTDETNPEWIAVLEGYGFTVVNHTAMRTEERFGIWFPTVLDSYLLSSGRGFLGVIYSTMSILAYRRTIDWNQGVARMIELDHQVPADWVWT